MALVRDLGRIGRLAVPRSQRWWRIFDVASVGLVPTQVPLGKYQRLTICVIVDREAVIEIALSQRPLNVPLRVGW
jgi:hypothetical protein